MKDSESLKAEIRNYLMTHRASKEVGSISDDGSLLEAGVIDSLAMVDLISHLQKTYDITIPEDDMTPENFDSITAIASYVESRRGKS